MTLPPDFLHGIRTNVWSLVDDDLVTSPVPDMLGATERKLLYWLANQHPLTDDECIVDAGAFLGGSSLCLAKGLSLSYAARKDYRIHAYDVFLVPNDAYVLNIIRRQPGESYLDLYLANTRAHQPLIAIHAGDIMHLPPPDAPIAVLFVDVAKTRAVNASFTSRFFARLSPGRGIVVQQDYNDHSCPWIKATMEHLSPWLDHLTDDLGSRLHLLREPIPADVLAEVGAGFPLAAELSLLRRAAERERSPASRFFIEVSMGWTLFEMDGIDAAGAHLAGLAQPFRSEAPYVDLVIGAMRWHGTPAHLDRHLSGYFDAAAG